MGDYDYLYKIVLVGDLGVGKTSLTRRFAEGKFSENYKATIGVDFTVQTVNIDNKLVKLQIWDTSGQERFRSITHGYFRNAHGAIIVYDMTNTESFQNAETWLQEVQQYSGYVTTNILVGNKADLSGMLQIPLSKAEAFAGTHGMIAAMETSAKDNTNVDEAFYKLAKELLRWNGASTCLDSIGHDSLKLESFEPESSYWNASCCWSS